MAVASQNNLLLYLVCTDFAKKILKFLKHYTEASSTNLEALTFEVSTCIVWSSSYSALSCLEFTYNNMYIHELHTKLCF